MTLKNVELERLEFGAEIFKGFGNPIRIRIIDALQENNLRVMELSETLGYPQPIISQQLKILKSVGIVQKVREGNSFCYRLTNNNYADMIKCMRGVIGA
jgi:ArsR family transcriptional regulator, zinc-responsive transcriptional repressor